ncbi:TIGR02206 family membrane protein [Nocardia cyriacigeorgica]|uniref:YwaF family protein n=1 Tax=Nocardia cyriacigeorgica TaxID=135487 RepID=UPI0018958FA1|nr:TIGR02206 family membrane protein [Nocardia cyriacigeorgica]MBF6160127.1 TIGR02206 family membrane protein [Nocardia cyriacigeorgica]MBF6199211.1 TIGR02206 family membrane protein [Nocardia cyriacigeorgica]MBF6343375.1 TIGR02206 family membrane protein [Nocardia cyriacigeorgica]MBF6516056.1 TIGR02206 family membrane protein [Nocardia cyriacigeorgica]
MAREFSAYGLSHLVVLAVFVVGAVAVVAIGRRERGEASLSGFSRGFGVVTLGIYAVVLGSTMFPPTVEQSVPLRLTDLATVVAGVALVTRWRWAYALTYFWCLTLSTQALVSPALESEDFPHYEFLGFWAIHLLVVWAAIYLTWGVGMRPDWGSYRIAVGATVAWVAVTFVFNSLADTNYGFVNRKPSTPSLLDVLGPWPWYLGTVAIILLVVWALMTWPWVRNPDGQK